MGRCSNQRCVSKETEIDTDIQVYYRQWGDLRLELCALCRCLFDCKHFCPICALFISPGLEEEWFTCRCGRYVHAECIRNDGNRIVQKHGGKKWRCMDCHYFANTSCLRTGIKPPEPAEHHETQSAKSRNASEAKYAQTRRRIAPSYSARDGDEMASWTETSVTQHAAVTSTTKSAESSQTSNERGENDPLFALSEDTLIVLLSPDERDEQECRLRALKRPLLTLSRMMPVSTLQTYLALKVSTQGQDILADEIQVLYSKVGSRSADTIWEKDRTVGEMCENLDIDTEEGPINLSYRLHKSEDRMEGVAMGGTFSQRNERRKEESCRSESAAVNGSDSTLRTQKQQSVVNESNAIANVRVQNVEGAEHSALQSSVSGQADNANAEQESVVLNGVHDQISLETDLHGDTSQTPATAVPATFPS